MQRTIRRYKTDISTSTRSSRRSDESQESQSTAPTQYTGSSRPSIHHAATDRPVYWHPQYDISPCATSYARSSTETYASTVASTADFEEELDSYDPEYDVPEYREVFESDVRPSNPSNFADFFPTTKRMYIRHDDTTYDGNMNLRVDTETRRKGTVQLFHLRMQDLKKREFSLRRYERSSGREVCHSARKYVKPATERPPLTKSMSSAFASIRKPDFKRADSTISQRSSNSTQPRRQDSGYGTDDEFDDERPRSAHDKKLPIPTNTTKLEFSNYAQVEVKRRGTKASKHYDFEYWGHSYTWKRITEKDGDGKAVSYHLYKGDSPHAIAHIVPEMRSPSQIMDEEAAGGWVPPCSLWISDKSLLEAVTDVCDIVVATGLITLVDDCIKRRFHTKQKFTAQVSVPLTPLKYDMEFTTPRAMVEQMFKRRNSGSSAKEREQRNSPLRYTNAVKAY